MTVEPVLEVASAHETERVAAARRAAEVGSLRDLPAWVCSPAPDEPDWVTTPRDADERRAESVANAILASAPGGPPDPPLDPPPESNPNVPAAFRIPGGHPLPPGLRRRAERTTGRDLSAVRVHDSREARRRADELQASAYTVGRQIVLGSELGTLAQATGSADGLRTLAHEIGHVVAPPARGKVGRDDPPQDDQKPKDTSITWKLYEPPGDVQQVLDEIPGYQENLKAIVWEKKVLDTFGPDEVANGTPDQVLRPYLFTIVCDNYVITVGDDRSVVAVDPQATAKVPPGPTRGIALAYPKLGLVWALGALVRAADKSEAMELRGTKMHPPKADATPGRSFVTIYLPGVSASPELVEKLKKPVRREKKVNTSDTPGWTKDQLADLKKLKARKASQQPDQKPAEPPQGGKDGTETGEGKGDTGEGKGAGHGEGEGVGEGKGPGEGGEPQDETQQPKAKEAPLKGPVKYSTWQGDKGPPQLVVTVDRAWTSIPLKEGESTESLEARADKALEALQASRDPANSTKVEGGVEETGFVEPKGSTAGTMQTQAQAEAQAKSTATHKTPGEQVGPGKGGIANAPEYPSKIVMTGRDVRFPAVTTSGATNEFTMDVDYAARSMGFQDEVFNRMQTIQFYWEVIDVTGVTVAKVKELSQGGDEATQKEAEELAAKAKIGSGEQETGLGAMGTNLRRDMNAIAEDQANDIQMMSDENWPWEARAAYLGVIGLSNVIRTVGSVIGSFIDVLTQPLNARSIGFDHNGDYIVRCVATPVVSDEAREDPDHHVIRRSSVAVLPIRVSDVNDRAVQGLNREDEAIAAREEKLRKAKEGGNDREIKNAQAELDALTEAKARTGQEELTTRIDYLRKQVKTAESLQKKRGQPPPTPTSGEKPQWYADWTDDEVSLAITLLGEKKTVATYLKEMTLALEQMTEKGHEDWVKTHATFEPVGPAKQTQFRPRLVLASEVTGQVTDVLCMLGQVSKGDNAPWRWQLVDITSPKTREVYTGSSAKTGEDGRAEAIRDCFRQFAEKSGYGRGTLAIRLPADLLAAVPAVSVEQTMRSAPGGADRGLSRLGDLAKAAMIAGLFVTGPAGLVIGAVGGVAGAIIAVNSLVKRARTGHLLEIGTIFDVLGVIGGAVGFMNAGVALVKGSAQWSKALAKAPAWLERLEKVENVLHIYGRFDNVQQLVSIPVQLAVEWDEIEKSGGSEGEKNSRKMKALLHALETGVITVAMMGGGLGKEDRPSGGKGTDSEAPLPKDTGKDQANQRADGQGPAIPPTVHPDEGSGAAKAEGSAPKKPPIDVEAAKELAQRRLEAAARAERGQPQDNPDPQKPDPKKTEEVKPDGDERTMAGTAKPGAKGEIERIADNNAKAKQEVIEKLQGRLGKETAPPRTEVKARQGEYGAPTKSADEALAAYDKAVSESAGREVGLFFNPNTGEFQVMVGTEHAVRGPKGDGWQSLVHLHPNPENIVTLRLPAPADVWNAVKAAFRTGSHTEFVQSTRPDGTIGITKVKVSTPPLSIEVEMPASPGEPARTIKVDTPDAYAKEYGRDTTHLEPGSDAYNWVMQDLDDYYAAKRRDEATARGVGPRTAPTGGTPEAKGAHAKAIDSLRQEVKRQQEKADATTKKMYDDVLAELDKLAADDAAGTSPDEVRKRIKEQQDTLGQWHEAFKPVPVSRIRALAQRLRKEASQTTKKDVKKALDDLAAEAERLADRTEQDPTTDPRWDFGRITRDAAGLAAKDYEVVFDLRDPVLRKQIIDWFASKTGRLGEDVIGATILKRWLKHLKATDLLLLKQSPRSGEAAGDLATSKEMQDAVKAAVKQGLYPADYTAEFLEAVAEGERRGRKDGWPVDAHGNAWQVDHVSELWLGGADDITNYVAIPERVHLLKNETFGQFRRDFRGRAVEGTQVDVRATDPKEKP